MTLQERIEALHILGQAILHKIYDDEFQAVMNRTFYHNAWFTREQQQNAVQNIAKSFLNREILEKWLSAYDKARFAHAPRRSVGLILAGNIPLVGFHDVLCVFLAGHKAIFKLSDKDKYLLPFLLSKLKVIDERTAQYFEQADGKLMGFEAIIATGSNNSARYFEAYFGQYPNIIRKNRNAVAVLTGEESREDLQLLGEDIFQYFGLGCRNVSKIYVPQNYDFNTFLEVTHEFSPRLVTYDRYKNNFEYQMTVLYLNKAVFFQNGCLLLTENESLVSPISVVYYEQYKNLGNLTKHLEAKKDEIQCIVAKNALQIGSIPCFGFGQAQCPAINDYADGVDTMAFLLNF
jgi:hypothetical protein